MNTFFVALLTTFTSALCVALGVAGAYAAVTGLLAVFNPARRALKPSIAALVPTQSEAGGD